MRARALTAPPPAPGKRRQSDKTFSPQRPRAPRHATLTRAAAPFSRAARAAGGAPPRPPPRRAPAPHSPQAPSAAPAFAWPLFGLARAPRATPAQEALAASLFGAGARFLGDERTMNAPGAPGGGGGAAAPGAPPLAPAWAELAFMGRSNAGKSTLLNALLGGDARERTRAFVPVSPTPGHTRALDFYGVGLAPRPRLVLVDTPGYGYSARGKRAHAEWMARVAEYLGARAAPARGGGDAPGAAALARVSVLVDARRGLTPLDEDVLRELDARAVPTHVVLTKVDLLRAGELAAVAARAAAALGRLRMVFPVLSAVSAATGAGMAELRGALMQTSKMHRYAGEAVAAAHDAQARAQAERDAGDARDDALRGALAADALGVGGLGGGA